MAPAGVSGVDLYEDALPGAFLGGLDRRFFLTFRYDGESGGSARIAEDGVTLTHVGQTVVEQREHVRRDLLTEAVACAQILVDPDLHLAAPRLTGWCVPDR